MSRVGKNEVVIPSSVVWTQEGSFNSFKGKLGVEGFTLPEEVSLEKTERGLKLSPKNQTMRARSLWGSAQRIIANMVKGVNEGYSVTIELVGVGYRASVAGSKLTMQLGFSHDVVVEIPEGITIKCEKPTTIVVSGASKQKVGQIAANLSQHRPPEPYKGKGMIRAGQFVFRKEGKKK